MRLSKSDRERVREKFGGRCAYCGCTLGERWHVDHQDPVVRLPYTGEVLRPDNHRLDNLMPACPPCNISKGSLALETWRRWIAQHVESLNRYHPIYRLVRAYGLITETGRPVVFHFEEALSRSRSPSSTGGE